MTNLNKLKKEKSLEVYQAYLPMQIQEEICKIMEKKNITQDELAKRMGVKKAGVSRLLSDGRNLTTKKIASVFHALGEEVEIITKSECTLLDSANETYLHGCDASILRNDHRQKTRDTYSQKPTPVFLYGEQYATKVKRAS